LTLLAMGYAHAEQTRSLVPVKPAPNAERRLALVIGNSAYKTSPLRNPVNDARAMAGALTETGFAVTLVEDGTQAGMRRAIRNFGDELARGGVGLFYYAGHGMQVRGRNFLIPVNADIQREDEVEDQAVDANLMLSKMDTAKNALNIMILDACRNNPFHRSFRSAAQGLAQMDAPSGTLIAFATAPGSVAADGEGENGTYTKHLLEQIRKPGTPVEQLFKQVRNGVMADTKERQVPWESSSLRGDFFFLMLPPGMQAEEQKRQQQHAIDKAVGDAVKQSEDRAARERAALEEQLKKMMGEMLAKQRAELDAELRRRGAESVAATPVPNVVAPPPPPVAPANPTPANQAPPVPAPAQVASVAPSPARGLLPRAGDSWRYRSWETGKPESRTESQVEVKAVQAGAVFEVRRGPHAGEWVHPPEATILGFRREDRYEFAPYLLAQREVNEGDGWNNVPFQQLNRCSHEHWLNCRFDVRVAASERVTVAAGTFDALRVEVAQRMDWLDRIRAPAFMTVAATFWYAPQARRYVKGTWKTTGGERWFPDTEFELVSYKLN